MTVRTKTHVAATPERIADVTALLARAVRISPEGVPALLSFSGREDYLGFVASWKAVYAVEVASIRDLKRIRRDATRSDDARSTAQCEREIGRDRARTALLLRAAGKDLARAARQRPAEAA